MRNQIENALAFVMTEGYRPKGDNPARWDGHLEFSLAKKVDIADIWAQMGQKIPSTVTQLTSF